MTTWYKINIDPKIPYPKCKQAYIEMGKYGKWYTSSWWEPFKTTTNPEKQIVRPLTINII